MESIYIYLDKFSCWRTRLIEYSLEVSAISDDEDAKERGQGEAVKRDKQKFGRKLCHIKVNKEKSRKIQKLVIRQ